MVRAIRGSIMRCTKYLAVALGAAGLAFMATTNLSAEVNAPASDRELIAKLIREALVSEAAKTRIEMKSAERHKEVIKNPIKDIVTYWRSDVSGTASFVEPDKKLTLDVPILIREKGKATLTIHAMAPVKGDVVGKALTDDWKQIIAVASPYTCRLAVTATCTVTRVTNVGGVAYKIEVAKWDPTVTDLKFNNGLDRVKGPIERLANDKLKAESAKLRDAANDALRKAYENGRLTLPN